MKIQPIVPRLLTCSDTILHMMAVKSEPLWPIMSPEWRIIKKIFTSSLVNLLTLSRTLPLLNGKNIVRVWIWKLGGSKKFLRQPIITLTWEFAVEEIFLTHLILKPISRGPLYGLCHLLSLNMNIWNILNKLRYFQCHQERFRSSLHVWTNWRILCSTTSWIWW